MDQTSNTDMNFKINAEILKALAHPVRLCIVHRLIDCKGCNVSNIQNCLGVPQSTISQHIATLRRFGIIAGERDGLKIIYKVVNPKARAIIDVLFND
ncbi:MAG TPA: metalloregulator ArsR/SmtB family transcription factor [Oscillospiraceae bacterium]|nr:metalloregulator ArsR/SmtB family transcription factor [Oscillospiraceae bacterium]